MITSTSGFKYFFYFLKLLRQLRTGGYVFQYPFDFVVWRCIQLSADCVHRRLLGFFADVGIKAINDRAVCPQNRYYHCFGDSCFCTKTCERVTQTVKSQHSCFLFAPFYCNRCFHADPAYHPHYINIDQSIANTFALLIFLFIPL